MSTSATERERLTPGAPQLRRKPLIEAIFEARWRLQEAVPAGFKRDPNYKFLLGKLFDAVRNEYPEHEQLPAAQLPDEMTPQVVHHRFRASKDGWPLLQVGPGIFTVNETSKYEWVRYEGLVNTAVSVLVDSYSAREALVFESLTLRFLNAIPLDFEKISILDFLAAKMRTKLSIPDSAFQKGQFDRKPVEMSTHLVFPSIRPSGALALNFSTGTASGDKALIFELNVTSKGPEVPNVSTEFGRWLADAHTLIEAVFFDLIEGDLIRGFRNGD
jgi:uncharacterized protein (TIGR04255 family)